MSKLSSNIKDILQVLISDEKLMRLLYYKARNYLDNVLEDNPDNENYRPNILNNDKESLFKSGVVNGNPQAKIDIITDRIKSAPKYDDLADNEKCRLCFYLGDTTTTGNFVHNDQEVIFDVLTHVEYEEKDFRNSKIIDRLNELLFHRNITGVGKFIFTGASRQEDLVENYTCYRVTYKYGSMMSKGRN
ncbi:hypothetical protein [Metabacillus litoralis]|uniref:hypothetical protein n=1 Tax=Metabacillus litoralis TaxID=152268 RepID=UPI002041F16E|nr:hypothetical protein [Metabacillus litoralis]MCM3161011.1 hypothetical protein [Metabacillus litoralis]